MITASPTFGVRGVGVNTGAGTETGATSGAFVTGKRVGIGDGSSVSEIFGARVGSAVG